MGFDPLNEPAVGFDNLLSAVYHIGEGQTDKSVLEPLFSRVYKEALQIASNKSIMHFEPIVFPDIIPFSEPVFGTQVLKLVRPVSYTKPPGGEIGSPYHSLSAHTYCCQMN